MKSFEQFVKENIEQKPKYKSVLDNEEQETSDGKEFDRVIDTEDDKEEEK